MSNSKDFSLGLITGAILGSAFALLFAPDKGKNTRDKISYRMSSYLDDLNDMIDQLKDEKLKMVSEAKEKGDKVVSDAKQRAEDLIKEAEDLLTNIEKTKS
jgi:gas vesicle protein